MRQAPMAASAPAPGPWQREYERDWRSFARRAIASALGVSALADASAVSPNGARELRKLMLEIGAGRKRAHSLTPQRGRGANDSSFLLEDVSYVYRTPRGKDSGGSSEPSLFPAFSSQDMELAASARDADEPMRSPVEVVASQRLVARMADLSPIAGQFAPSPVQPADSSAAAAISAGFTKSPAAPGSEMRCRESMRKGLGDAEGNESPARDRTSPSVNHLDESMQSLHLSDDERSVFQESVHRLDNGSSVPKNHVQRSAPRSRRTSGARRLQQSPRHLDTSAIAGSGGRDGLLSERQVDGAAAVVGAAEPRVSKILTFSDSDDSDVGVTVLEPSDRPQQQEKAGNPRTGSTSSMSGAEPEPEFGTGFDAAAVPSSPHTTANREVTEPAQVDQGVEDMEIDQIESHQVPSRASDDQGHEISDLTQPQPRSRRRRRLSQRPRAASSRPATTNAGQQEQAPPQVMRTKLPLQVEYRFASDRKRRARRRRTLERAPGFPYRRPEYAVELQPYQNEAVQWMLDRERGSSSVRPEEALVSTATTPAGRRRRRQNAKIEAMAASIRGGILADEMGLGKTVCCIALVCESLRMSREACRLEQAASENPEIPRLRPPTLIITPLSILTQWEHELRSRTNLSVVTYQGSTRKSVRTADEFMGVDVVLSTYDTLRLKECKVRPYTTSRHVDSEDSDTDQDEDMSPSTTTAAATTPWQLAARLTPAASRHRPGRRGKAAASEVTSKLHQLAWHRVILDESHLITNAACARAQAACSLKSSRRWCVTGTPVQNSSQDLASLVQFLCSPRSASSLLDRLGGDDDVDSALRELVPHIMLRRLKTTLDPESRTPILALPPKIEETRALEFATDVERALHLLLHRSTKRMVLQYLSAGAGSRAATTLSTRSSALSTPKAPQFMHVFELLLRLRQTCDACALVTSDPRAEVDARSRTLRGVGSGNDLGLNTPSQRDGGDDWASLSAGEIALLRGVCAPISGAERGGFPTGCEQLSTKVEALLAELRALAARGDKALVVSQWTSFLDLIAQRLELHNSCAAAGSRRADEPGIAFDTLDGRLSSKQRDVVVQRFQRERTLDVLLLSLRTGGLGLNLTAATHVFIMEPSWNPSLESQAVDRAHRFGQRRPVRVVRFLMRGTIEERVVALQRKKQQLAASLLGDPALDGGGGGGRGARLTRQDLRELFEAAGDA